MHAHLQPSDDVTALPRNPEFHTEANRIFFAQQAARRLAARASAEKATVLGMSRDELAALAQQLTAVADIAERYHLERATAGSLPADVFPGPTE